MREDFSLEERLLALLPQQRAFDAHATAGDAALFFFANHLFSPFFTFFHFFLGSFLYLLTSQPGKTTGFYQNKKCHASTDDQSVPTASDCDGTLS